MLYQQYPHQKKNTYSFSNCFGSTELYIVTLIIYRKLLVGGAFYELATLIYIFMVEGIHFVIFVILSSKITNFFLLLNEIYQRTYSIRQSIHIKTWANNKRKKEKKNIENLPKYLYIVPHFPLCIYSSSEQNKLVGLFVTIIHQNFKCDKIMRLDQFMNFAYQPQ